MTKRNPFTESEPRSKRNPCIMSEPMITRNPLTMSEPGGAAGESRQPPEKAKEKGMTEAIELKSRPLPGLLNSTGPLQYVLRPPSLLSNPARAHLKNHQVRPFFGGGTYEC